MRKSVEFGRALKVIEYNRVSFPCRSEARGTSESEFTHEPKLSWQGSSTSVRESMTEGHSKLLACAKHQLVKVVLKEGEIRI